MDYVNYIKIVLDLCNMLGTSLDYIKLVLDIG